ncbi:BatD family protein [Candidatus Avelusimicrobium sp.]
MWKKILLILLLSFATQAQADLMGVSVSASVNKTNISMNDELKLTLTIDGAAGNITPQLPSTPSFNVYQVASTQQIDNFHAITRFEYIMMPRFPGKATIGPISVQYGNKTYQTDPIEINVFRAPNTAAPQKAAASQGMIDTSMQGASARKAVRKAPDQAPAEWPALERILYNTAAKRGNEHFFMIAAVDNASPYVNQLTTLAIRFYYDRPFLNNAPYIAPSLSNLVMEELGVSDGNQSIDGRNYAYKEMRYAISGVTPGKASVSEAEIRYVPDSGFDISMFDKMFAALSKEPQTAKSNIVNLTIRPVPTQDQPKSFYGAVGTKYSISADVDRKSVEAGEAINLTITLNGTGNLKPTSDLKLPRLNGFKTYDVVSTSGVGQQNGSLKSYKIFKSVIVPSASGSYIIPKIAWSYFDPVKKTYYTIYTTPISVNVTPSTKADSGFDFSTSADLGNGFRQLTQDIRYLKSALSEPTASFIQKAAAHNWLFYPPLLLLGMGLIFAFSDKKTLAQKRALSNAKTQLKKALKADEVADALSTYLQLRYRIHTASLPLREISNALKKCGCPPNLVERFETIWQKLDAVRFAPVAMQGEGAQELARQSLELIKDMESKGGHA